MMNYEQREAAKQEAWAVLGDSEASTEKKAWHALHGLIAAHYWRAREALDNANARFRRRVHGRRYSPGYELDIDVYTQHWLAANEDLLSPAVVAEITATWGYVPKPHAMLPKGATYYRERAA